MNKWPIKKLGEVASIQMGQSPPGETYNTDSIGLPFFQGKAEFGDEYPTVAKWCNKPTRIAEFDDVLLSVRAPVGPTNFAPGKCCIGRGLAAIRGHAQIDQRYIRYYLKRFENTIASYGVGSTFTAINRKDIESLELPLPDLSEQERLVNLLDEADELRKWRAQADTRTRDLIPAIFQEMFGDPIRNHFNFPVCKLGQICNIVGGGTPSKKKSDYWVGKIPWVSPKDMTGDEIFDSEDHISEMAIKESATNLINQGSILIVTRSGILKHTLPVAINRLPVTINQDIKALIPNDYLESVFLVSQIKILSPTILGLVRVGATVQNIETNALRNMDVLKPPISLQKEFAQRVAEVREMESEQTESRNQLNALFQSLLHRAFEGSL